jgi:hypothetical protein
MSCRAPFSIKAASIVSTAIIMFVAASSAIAETFSYEAYILNRPDRSLLTRGDKNYSVEDTVVTDEETFLRKELRLENGFVVRLTDMGSPQLDGLGFWFTRDLEPHQDSPLVNFNWEWFNRLNNEGIFDKLQGKGRIRVRTRLLNGRVRVERVEFLEDIVFRMHADPVRGNPREHTHEMLIHQGNVLAFPSEPPRPTTMHRTGRVAE